MKKKKVLTIILIFLICIFIAGTILSMIQVVCVSQSEVWALPPRKTISNVILALTEPGDKFHYLGTYTDSNGIQWYIVSGVLDIYKPAGQNIGFIKQDDANLAFGWVSSSVN